MKKLYFFLIICAILTIPFINVYSQQTSFQISAPPIPWFEFNKGQKDLKVNGTALYMTGKIDDPNAGGDVKVYGAGGSGFYRYAFKEKFAYDIGGLILGAGGNVGDDATMNMTIFSFPFDLESQPVKKDSYSVIIFAGFNFTWFNLGMEFDDGTDNAAINIWSSLRGPQAGIQVAIKYPEFVFTPFFMITSMSGDAKLDVDYNGSKMSLNSGIPASTSCYYGIDIIYLPWDTTLSSVIQQALSSGDNQGYKTYVLMISYHFQLEEGENSVEIPPFEKQNQGKTKKNQLNKGKKIQQ